MIEEAEGKKMPAWAVVPQDVAEDEFARWAETMALTPKFDESLLNDEEVADLRSSKHTVLCAIMDGRLVVNENGDFVFTPSDVGSDGRLGAMVFGEPTMAQLREANREKSKIDQQNKLIALMTNKDATVLSRMRSRNFRVCGAIVGLFLG